MVTVAIRALELEYLVKILDWGQSRSRYIFLTPIPPKIPSDSDSTAVPRTSLGILEKQKIFCPWQALNPISSSPQRSYYATYAIVAVSLCSSKHIPDDEHSLLN
jgi:hypothetical protein